MEVLVNKESKIKVGIIGIGFGQAVLAPAFALHHDCHLKAICATSEERALAVAAKLGIDDAYGDWRRLLQDSSLDAVAVATPPTIQPEIVIAALNSGKAVFCEKPLAASLAPAQAMLQAAGAAGRANMVDFEFPEVPVWREAKRVLDAGAVGGIRQAAVDWSVETYAVARGLTSWKTRRENGGGVLFAFLPHVFYYLEFLLGPIAELSCRLFATAAVGKLGETFVSLALVTAAGTPVSVSVSTASFLGSGHSIEIDGDEGTLLLRNPGPDYIRGFRLFHATRGSKQLKDISSDSESESLTTGDARVVAVSRLTGRFLDWIRFDRPACPSFRQGLRVQMLLERAVESHNRGKWVRCEQQF